MSRVLPAAVALVLVLAACGGQATTTTAAPTTTTAAPTTTTAAPTTTTTYGNQSPDLSTPDPLPGSGGAAGSGCSPGSGSLPDGVWFGFAVSRTATSVRFDLACFFVGDAATAAASADGAESPNDFYIRNQNPALREETLTGNAAVWSITGDPTAGLQKIAFGAWPVTGSYYGGFCPGSSCPVWLYVNGAKVTEMVEQYLP